MAFLFAHNNINVLELERSVAFYRDALGLRVAGTKEAADGSFRLAFLTDGVTGHQLELTWLRDRTEPYNLGDNEIHLAFTADDMDAAHTLHEKLGCICYENPGMGIYFIADPDGYWTEIVPRKLGDMPSASAIFHRVSIRKYQARPVEEAKLTLLMRAAMASPSATNQQPWEFYIVRDPELIRQLSGSTPYTKCAAEAPVLIVPCFRKETRIPAFAQIDLSICCENILLAADGLGLGAVWLGIAPMTQRMDLVARTLHADESLSPFAIIACGYPAEARPQEDRYDESRVHYL